MTNPKSPPHRQGAKSVYKQLSDEKLIEGILGAAYVHEYSRELIRRFKAARANLDLLRNHPFR